MKQLAAVFGLLALGACTTQPGEGVGFYNGQPGVLTDGPALGEATMNNTQIMTGEKSYALNLSRKFANTVPSMVNFAFDSATLDAQAQAALRQQAHFIRQYPEVRFRVYGHTDLVGSDAYNRRLGLRRARAVVNFLVSQGISRSRLEAVASFGETQPLVVTEGRERRNRRTVTEVSGFVRSHPLIMDGKYAQVVYREYVKSAEPASTLLLLQEDTGGGEE